MTTCLDINTCPTNKLYDIRCNFITNYLGINYEYVCNPHTTCMRTHILLISIDLKKYYKIIY